MARIYREMWEGASDLMAKIKAERTEKKYFNKIIIKSSTDNEGSDYFTISVIEDIFNNKELQSHIVSELTKGIGFYLKKYNLSSSASVLVVGLGNCNITADSLGARVCDKIIVTKHLYGSNDIATKWGCLSCIKPSVSGVTGINSYDIIKSIIDCDKPDLIIAVDTLACNDYSRLASTIQISDDGIEPGAGVGNPKPKLSYGNLSIPIVAIGVPLVIYISKLIFSLDKNSAITIPKNLLDLVVTAKEIDFQISDFSNLISESINQTVHNNIKSYNFMR